MSDVDKPALRPANDNPWYCLATVHGEQPVDSLDDERASKNRLAWNRWIATALSDKERASLVKSGFPEPQLAPLSPEEKSAFCRAFVVRTGRESELPPEPTESHYDFSSTHFDHNVFFSGLLFWQPADFSSARFDQRADFCSARFDDSADFSSAEFLGSAMFIEATFVDAEFGSATFSSSAQFSHSTIEGAEFTSVIFADIAYFNSTKLHGADFSFVTFGDHADFSSATFSDYTEFNSAKFLSRVGFVNAKFTERTEFVDTHFQTDVPDFRGATLHEATEWHGVIWPKAPKDKDAAQAQVYAYERLKLEMERLKKHDDEQRFFRKELRARRDLARPGSGDWILNFLYQVSSNYGQSVVLPLSWLFGLFAIGSVFYVVHTTIPHAAALSFANLVPFVPITHEFINANAVVGLSRMEKIVGVAQTLLGIPLLFLLGLALRNRFRMK